MNIIERYKERTYEIKNERYLRVGVCYSNVMMDIDIEYNERIEEEINKIVEEIKRSEYIYIDKAYKSSSIEKEYEGILIRINKIIGITRRIYEKYNKVSIYGSYKLLNNKELGKDISIYKWNSYENQLEKWRRKRINNIVLYESEDNR